MKSPGVPARGAGGRRGAARAASRSCGELELAWRLVDAEFIAVTGTNGKTTTVELLGDDPPRGRGAGRASPATSAPPTRRSPARIWHGAIVVCEASSFQLEDTRRVRARGGVLLNLEPDHLDRHGTLEAYRDGEARRPSRVRAPRTSRSRRSTVPGARAAGWRRLEIRDGALVHEGERIDVRLRGAAQPRQRRRGRRGRARPRHRSGRSAPACATFAGVEHRLEEVADASTASLYVNDSKATNVASTLVALASFDRRRCT